jgi:hypothetical protein
MARRGFSFLDSSGFELLSRSARGGQLVKTPVNRFLAGQPETITAGLLPCSLRHGSVVEPRRPAAVEFRV